MNAQLIPVFAGKLSGTPTQLVDARLLHTFLESAQEFANWIKNRIEDYGFIEAQDFLIKLSKTKGRPAKDYHLTIDMAKELGMIERNEKGRQIRRYFLDMERQVQYGLKQLPEPKTKKSLPGCLTLEQQDVIKQLVNGRAEDLPKDKKAAAVIKGWSAIKNKFGCTYKEISPDNFVNVISLITRLPIDGELLEKPEQLPSNTFTVDLNTPVGLQQITFKFLIEGYSSGRWLMYLDNGTFTIRPMKEDELCMSFDKWLNFANSERGYLVIKKSEVLDRLMHSNGGVK